MSNTLATFSDSAKGLAKNPLGIIALFIVLVYGFAALVVGASRLEAGERLPLIWFLVIFPVLVLAVFGWLVSCHHTKLFAPADYKDESNFVASINPALTHLAVAPPPTLPKANNKAITIALAEGKPTNEPNLDRANERSGIYEACRGIFIAHVLQPSKDATQEFDIYIYLIRHKSADFSDVVDADFFFGHYWGNRIFTAQRSNGVIGVQTSAYGPFLCTSHVTFTDGQTITIHKYIDFEMGRAFKKQA